MVKLQVRNKKRHLRRLPRRLRERRVGCCSGPVFIIALYWKTKVEANIEMVSSKYPDARPGLDSLFNLHCAWTPKARTTEPIECNEYPVGCQSSHSPTTQSTVSPEASLPEFISCRQCLPIYSLSMNANCLRKSNTNAKDSPTRLWAGGTLQEHRV